MKDIFHIEVNEDERQLILDVLTSLSTVSVRFEGCNTLDFTRLRDINYWESKLKQVNVNSNGLLGLINKSFKVFSTLDSLPKLLIDKDHFKLGPNSISQSPTNAVIKYKSIFYFQRSIAGEHLLLKLINFPFIRN
jgi:hypothetical protein